VDAVRGDRGYGPRLHPEGDLRHREGSDPAVLKHARGLLVAAILCNDATLDEPRWKMVGDPTAGALIVAGRKAGLDETRLREQLPRLDEIPFDSERQYMATLHAAVDGRHLVSLKGAPEAWRAFAGTSPKVDR
jgi:magnesium-transporting ATPase (P-type)